jgi:hypothetical protein
MENSGLSYETCKKNTDLFIDWIIKEIKNEFDVELVRSDFIKLDSCRENKLSFHVMIQKKIFFENVSDHKIFILYMLNRFNNPNDEEEENIFKTLTWTYEGKSSEVRRIFDKNPYSNYQCFRLVGQSKKGKPYILKNETEYSNVDTLVRLNNGIGNRVSLSVSSLSDNILLQNKEKSSKSTGIKKVNNSKKTIKEIEDIIDFVTEGETLMQIKNMTYADIENYQNIYNIYI